MHACMYVCIYTNTHSHTKCMHADMYVRIPSAKLDVVCMHICCMHVHTLNTCTFADHGIPSAKLEVESKIPSCELGTCSTLLRTCPVHPSDSMRDPVLRKWTNFSRQCLFAREGGRPQSNIPHVHADQPRIPAQLTRRPAKNPPAGAAL